MIIDLLAFSSRHRAWLAVNLILYRQLPARPRPSSTAAGCTELLLVDFRKLHSRRVRPTERWFIYFDGD